MSPTPSADAPLAAIVPRWEWRTFADDLGGPGARFDALTPDQVQESEETYLLSMRSDASIKLRDDLADVKVLEEVAHEGLERWRPVLKAAPPLSHDDVRTAMRAANVDPGHLGAGEYTPARIVEELERPHPSLMTVRVHKRRERFTLGGCMAERTEVRTVYGTRQTIAVESEDPAKVLDVLRDLGLAGRANICLARELKAMVGFGTRSFAVIDVGTNSVKLHIGAVRADGGWETVVDRAVVTRLGEGLDESGVLGEEPIARTVEAIAGMAEEARRHGVETIAAVGTAGLRIAPNRAALIDAVRERTGVEVEVISGEEESRLAYLAATSSLGPATGSLAVFDTGGGSSQFTFGDGHSVDERFSVNVGAARFTERFGLDGAVSEAIVRSVLDAIGADLARLDGRTPPGALVGMGGAVTNLSAVAHGLADYDPEVIQGSVLERAEIDRQIEVYRTSTADDRRRIPGLQANRAEVILAGACIVRTILDKLGVDRFTVSDRGLRHGLLAERFLP